MSSYGSYSPGNPVIVLGDSLKESFGFIHARAIQANTDLRKSPQKTREKVGFKKEGVIWKVAFMRGAWRDGCLYSMLKEE